MSAKFIYSICIEKIRIFENSWDETDNRNGLYSGEVTIEKLDRDGNFIERLDTHGSIHSGLRKSALDTRAALRESARAVMNAYRAAGLEAYLLDGNRDPGYWSSPDDLNYYISERNREIERKMKADELRAQAKALLEKARQIQANELVFA